MADQQALKKNKNQDQSSSQAGVPLENGREVVVTYVDAPPAAGDKSIHPRRPAPVVPDRKNQTGE
jgi:hypothetical protein